MASSQKTTLKELIRLLAKHAKDTGFNISAAARDIGVDRKTVRYHLDNLKEG